MANENLHKAKEAKNDEFYTQLNDVAEELRHYKEHFKGKVVFCNCDDPTSSAFWRYFHLNFDHLGLKKLISTHYDKKRPTYKMEYTGGDDNNIEAGVKTPLEGNGDFRNQECIDLLEEADIVVTNPPFSLFRDYVSVLEEHNKKFLIIGNPNAVTYKEFFPLLKENKVWIGAKPWSSEMYFGVPEEQADYLVKNKKEGSAYVIRNGQILGRAATLWFTNLDIKKRHEKLILWKNYTPAEFPQYDNYDAINVDKVSNIPCDYCESWEVTEEEFKNLSADEWEITREGEFDGEKSFFIIPAANTELRKLLHEHTAGYKEEIEKEISKKIQKNIFIDDSKTGDLQDRRPARQETCKTGDLQDRRPARQETCKTEDLQDRRPARQETCKTGIAEENLESQLPSATNSILLNSGLSATNTHLLSTEAEDTFMERGCTVESSYRRFCNGIFGVPITFLDKYNSAQFEIIGATESEGKGFSNGLWFAESGIAQPLINKQRKYKRLFARKIL